MPKTILEPLRSAKWHPVGAGFFAAAVAGLLLFAGLVVLEIHDVPIVGETLASTLAVLGVILTFFGLRENKDLARRLSHRFGTSRVAQGTIAMLLIAAGASWATVGWKKMFGTVRFRIDPEWKTPAALPPAFGGEWTVETRRALYDILSKQPGFEGRDQSDKRESKSGSSVDFAIAGTTTARAVDATGPRDGGGLASSPVPSGEHLVNLSAAITRRGIYQETVSVSRVVNPRAAASQADIATLREQLATRIVEAIRGKPHAAASEAINLTNDGIELFDKGRYEEASSSFTRAIEYDPQYALAHQALALVHYQRQRYPEAEAELRSAIRLSKPDAVWLIELGLALDRQGGRTREAVDEYKKAIEVDPQYAPAYNSLAFALMELGELAEAESNVREALQLIEHGSDAAFKAMLHKNFGRILHRQGRLKPAELELEEARRSAPGYAEPLFYLAKVLQDRGKVRDACTVMREYASVASKSKTIDEQEIGRLEASQRMLRRCKD